MKKFLSINTLAALLMAGAAFTACSSEDTIIDEQPVVNPTQKTVTMTVKASKDEVAGTRGLSLNGKTLNAVWKTTDVIKVYKNLPGGLTLVGTLNPTSNTNGTATLTGTVSDVAENDKLVLFIGLGNGQYDYTGQKGVLYRDVDATNSIESKYDYANAGIEQAFYAHFLDASTLTLSSSNQNTFGAQNYEEATASFSNENAIVKFTLVKSDGTTEINASQLVISCPDILAIGTNPSSTGSLTINPATPTNVLYVAIRCSSKDNGNSKMTLTAYADDEYTCSNTKNIGSPNSRYFFEPGKYYEVKVKMNPAHTWTTVDLSSDNLGNDGAIVYLPSSSVTEENKYVRLTGDLTNNGKHPIVIRNGAVVKLDGVTIPTQEKNAAGISCLGDATLILNGTNSVTGGNYNNKSYSGVIVPAGKTLTIKGNGTLYATGGGKHAAGIGSCADDDITLVTGVTEECGNISIEGGEIHATGGEGAPGIGAGSQTCGTITITGGEVYAEAGPGETVSSTVYHAAAIGTSPWNTSCGAISITGGSVFATSDDARTVIGDAASDPESSSTWESINIGSGINQVVIFTGVETDAYDYMRVKDFLKAKTVTIGSYNVTSEVLNSTMTPDEHALITAIKDEFPESAFTRPAGTISDWRLGIKRVN